MRIKASIYQDVEGVLHQVGKGECLAYSPEGNDGKVKYVSLNFGEHRIHLDKDDFLNFCNHFLKFSMYNSRKRLK